MKYLIDTHIFLWFCENNPKLPKKTRDLLVNNKNNLVISQVSFWEISIKLSLRKLKIKSSFEKLYSYVKFKELELLDFKEKDYKVLMNLDFYHRDPFDRMIISQAITRDIPIVTADKAFENYNVTKIFN